MTKKQKAALKRLLLAGDQMSNACFNLKQDKKLAPSIIATLGKCQDQWDSARIQLGKK